MITEAPLKSRGVTLVLCALGFLGLGGIHYFYHKKIGWGLLYFFTLGFLGIGSIVDFMRILLGKFPAVEPPRISSVELPTSAKSIAIIAIALLISAVCMMCSGFILVNVPHLILVIIKSLLYILYWILVIATLGLLYLLLPKVGQPPSFTYSPFSLFAAIAAIAITILLLVFLIYGIERARLVYAIVSFCFMPFAAITGFIITPILVLAYLLIPLHIWILYSEPVSTWVYRRHWITNFR